MIEDNICTPLSIHANMWRHAYLHMHTRNKKEKGCGIWQGQRNISVGREEPRNTSLIPEIRGAKTQAPTVSSRRTGCSWRGQPTQSVKDTAQMILRMCLLRRGVSLLSFPEAPFVFPEGHIQGSSSTESLINQLPSILPGRQDRMPEPLTHTWLPSCPCP